MWQTAFVKVWKFLFFDTCWNFLWPLLSISFLVLNLLISLLYIGLYESSFSGGANESHLWWFLLDSFEVHSRWPKSSFCSKICCFESRVQHKISCCPNNYGGVLSSYGWRKNWHRHDTPCTLQLGVSTKLYFSSFSAIYLMLIIDVSKVTLDVL